MLKKLIPAVAIAAMLLSPSLASARVGVNVSPNIGNIGTVRVTQPTPTPPRIHSNVKLLNCQKVERHNPYNDTVIYRTVCH